LRPGEEFEVVDVSIICEVAKGATSQIIEIYEKQDETGVDRADREFGFT
jgi:hypothetical protein